MLDSGILGLDFLWFAESLAHFLERKTASLSDNPDPALENQDPHFGRLGVSINSACEASLGSSGMLGARTDRLCQDENVPCMCSVHWECGWRPRDVSVTEHPESSSSSTSFTSQITEEMHWGL